MPLALRKIAFVATALTAVSAVSAGAAPGTASAARTPVARLSQADPVGDLGGTKRDEFSPSVDIVGVRYRFRPAAKRLMVTVRFADLRKVRGPGVWHKEWITLETGSAHYEKAFSVYRSPWAEGSRLTRIEGDATARCKGMRFTQSVPKNTVVFDLPARCLDAAPTASFFVMASAAPTYEDGEGDSIGYDQTQRSKRIRIH